MYICNLEWFLIKVGSEVIFFFATYSNYKMWVNMYVILFFIVGFHFSIGRFSTVAKLEVDYKDTRYFRKFFVNRCIIFVNYSYVDYCFLFKIIFIFIYNKWIYFLLLALRFDRWYQKSSMFSWKACMSCFQAIKEESVFLRNTWIQLFFIIQYVAAEDRKLIIHHILWTDRYLFEIFILKASNELNVPKEHGQVNLDALSIRLKQNLLQVSLKNSDVKSFFIRYRFTYCTFQ